MSSDRSPVSNSTWVNSHLFANEIDCDFWVNHNVTIGSIGKIPNIGNRVIGCTGAVVVGLITIGNDIFISANLVSSTSVPSGKAAYALAAVVKIRKGFSMKMEIIHEDVRRILFWPLGHICYPWKLAAGINTPAFIVKKWGSWLILFQGLNIVVKLLSNPRCGTRHSIAE